MKRHVKASSAGSISGSDSSRSPFGRALATRDALREADGSGAPSLRSRTALLAAVVAAFALLAFAPLSQAKLVINGFGSNAPLASGEGSLGLGGQFSTAPGGVAVNSTGNGGVPKGTVYTVDTALRRVQRFSSVGVFERAWGQNVIGHDERQRIVINSGEQGALSGSFKLTFGAESVTIPVSRVSSTSSDINPTVAELKSALEALPSIGAGNLTVTGGLSTGGGTTGGGGSFLIRFLGALSGTDVPPLVADASQLTGIPPLSVTASTLENGSGGNSQGFEICTVASQCKDGEVTTAIANGGQLNAPQGIAINQANGHVYVTESANRRVSEFDADGNFVRAWGWDVVGINEVQTVTVNATGGKFKLSFGADSTAELNGTVTAANMQIALRGLPSIGGENVTVTLVTAGTVRTYTVTFTGALAGTNVSELIAANGPLTPLTGGAGTVAVATTQTGTGGPFTGLETCTVASECKMAAPGGGGAGQFGQGTMGLPTVDSSGNVWIPEPISSQRIQEFTSSGAFIKMVGGDVVNDGATGTGTLSTANTTVSAVTTTSKVFRVGQTITAAGGQIPAGTTITAVGSNSITLSQKPTAAGSGVALSVAPGAENVPFNEKQTIALSNAIGGTFKLSFSTPNPSSATATAVGIPYNATAAAVEAKLAALPNLGAANVAVTGPNGGPWTVEFKGTRFADTDVESLQSLEASTDLQAPSGSLGQVTITAVNASEVCTIAADCRAGAAGASPGQWQFGSPSTLALDSSGSVYVPDPGNRRVLKFNPALTSVSDFGNTTFPAFTATAPTQVISTQGGSRLLFAVNKVTDPGPSPVSEVELLEIDPTDASIKETSLVGAGLGSVSGLGVNSNTGDLYLTTSSASSPRRALVLSSALPADPEQTMDSVSVKTDTTATFSGTVNPKGSWVGCIFQYSTDQSTWTDVAEPDCDSLSPTGGPQAVSQAVTGLIPGRHYFVRLAVSRPFAPGSTKTTLAKSFDTTGAVPTFGDVGALDVQDMSARLIAVIDPRNSATGYVFQYGTTPALGSSTAPVDIGGGAATLLVSQTINGLKPNTTYYFKVVATNLVGSAASAGKSFKTRTEPLPLPGGRAYEQVSPVDKNFGGVDFTALFEAANAANGEAAGFCTAAGLPTDPPGQITGACSNYVSHRATDGWGTKPVNPATCALFGLGHSPDSIPSLNLDHAVVSVPIGDDCPSPPLAPGAPTSGNGYALYRENLLSSPVSFDSVAPVAVASLGLHSGEVATSDDVSHVVYKSNSQQTADAPAGSFGKIFDWDADSGLSLVSKSTSNVAFTTTSSVPEDAVNGVSANGDRIFFQNPATGIGSPFCSTDACELYRRENSITTWVSQQECTVACSNTSGADEFEWAATDGSRAFFRSSAKLVDGDTQGGSDLYLYTDSANPATDPHNLAFLSKDNEPADGVVADVRGLLGASDDGETAYFVATGQLVLGQPVAAGPKVYRWQWNGGNPTIQYLATLLPGAGTPGNGGDERLWNGVNGRPLIRLVTPDGKYLLVQTRVQLDPLVDRDSSRDIYRWSEQAGWSCASCQEAGQPSTGISKIDGTDLTGYVFVTTNQGLMNRELRNVMSEDGQRIFFTTTDALSPQDQNGTVEDAYEWHDGVVNLISSGRDQREVLLIGASASGRDVFFITFEKLVGWDIDANTDIYDARVGGGFPEPPATGAPCEGEACRTAASSASPAASGAGTAVFQGAGNPSPKQATCPKGKVRRRGQCVKKPAKKHAKKKHSKQAGKRAKHSQRRASR